MDMNMGDPAVQICMYLYDLVKCIQLGSFGNSLSLFFFVCLYLTLSTLLCPAWLCLTLLYIVYDWFIMLMISCYLYVFLAAKQQNDLIKCSDDSEWFSLPQTIYFKLIVSVYLCITLLDYIWICFSVFDKAWLCFTLFDSVCLYLALCKSVWLTKDFVVNL